MKRRLFTILSALSLLLFVAVVVLSARSCFVADDLRGRWTKKLDDLSIGVLCDSGAFHVSVYRIARTQVDPDVEEGRRLSWSKEAPKGQVTEGLWFDLHRNNFRIGPTEFSETLLAVPAWAVLLVTSALPAAWLVNTVRRRRRVPGLCASCAYDLRATPERCPECGSVTRPAASTIAGTPLSAR